MTSKDYLNIIKKQADEPTAVYGLIQRMPYKLLLTPAGFKAMRNTDTPCTLFEAEQHGEKFLYKVSNEISTFSNMMLAQKISAAGVKVPDVKIFACNGVFFERYKKIPGKTLTQALLEGMRPEKYQQILVDVLIADNKINRIPLCRLSDDMITNLAIYNKRKQQNTIDFGKTLANIYYPINKKLTSHGYLELHHCDLNPSNILLDENDNFKALLDLNGVAICDRYTMLCQILLSWPDLDLTKVLNASAFASGHTISEKHLKKMLKIKMAREALCRPLKQIMKRVR